MSVALGELDELTVDLGIYCEGDDDESYRDLERMYYIFEIKISYEQPDDLVEATFDTINQQPHFFCRVGNRDFELSERQFKDLFKEINTCRKLNILFSTRTTGSREQIHIERFPLQLQSVQELDIGSEFTKVHQFYPIFALFSQMRVKKEFSLQLKSGFSQTTTGRNGLDFVDRINPMITNCERVTVYGECNHDSAFDKACQQAQVHEIVRR